eukprot:CAMPEP_0206447918 /NCGR_PEP_ID=MMETSP0324_2-20121206/17127_1 /ASSEMBLY_ACC=CAM_ASM_000836 /TAXON_ID=2866 /ORGANISM="Crypthecodinium cohnii, Strain Seligo" /LENGTH=127 /DNA_ID=CAMNT_0053916891 /DNA_START=186 /DNA_END=570 /DNA_ORIENTATION=-
MARPTPPSTCLAHPLTHSASISHSLSLALCAYGDALSRADSSFASKRQMLRAGSSAETPYSGRPVPETVSGFFLDNGRGPGGGGRPFTGKPLGVDGFTRMLPERLAPGAALKLVVSRHVKVHAAAQR